MSVDLWNWTELCEYKPCPGDCDLCNKEVDYVRLAEDVGNLSYHVLGPDQKATLHAAAELIERMGAKNERN